MEDHLRCPICLEIAVGGPFGAVLRTAQSEELASRQGPEGLAPRLRKPQQRPAPSLFFGVCRPFYPPNSAFPYPFLKKKEKKEPQSKTEAKERQERQARHFRKSAGGPTTKFATPADLAAAPCPREAPPAARPRRRRQEERKSRQKKGAPAALRRALRRMPPPGAPPARGKGTSRARKAEFVLFFCA
jgi:hypothetical protein